MAIFVSAEDEDGETLRRPVDISRVQRHFSHVEGSVCLRFVSGSEDAMFNQAQLPLLVAEAESVAAKTLKKEEAEEVAKVLSICRDILGKPRCYVKFYGDDGREG